MVGSPHICHRATFAQNTRKQRLFLIPKSRAVLGMLWRYSADALAPIRRCLVTVKCVTTAFAAHTTRTDVTEPPFRGWLNNRTDSDLSLGRFIESK